MYTVHLTTIPVTHVLFGQGRGEYIYRTVALFGRNYEDLSVVFGTTHFQIFNSVDEWWAYIHRSIQQQQKIKVGSARHFYAHGAIFLRRKKFLGAFSQNSLPRAGTSQWLYMIYSNINVKYFNREKLRRKSVIFCRYSLFRANKFQVVVLKM
jgi:hypothetical protein